MASISLHQEIIEKLHKAYNIKGYLTEESVYDAIIEYNLPLDEVEYLCDHLLSMGVIICDASIENSDDDEDDYDRSQTDYDKLFQEVVEIDKSLAPFINEIRKIRPPQRRELQNLMPHAKSDNHYAKQRIIEMYLRTVVRIALWHHKKYKIPLADTIQDGCVGLVIALDKYDVGRQDEFITYASLWIWQNIIRAAPTLNPLMYIPVNVKNKFFSIYDILEKCYHCYKCDCNKICSEVLKAVSEIFGCNEDEAEEYINYLNPFESIEELIEKDESLFYDNFAAEEQIITNFFKKELENTIKKILQTLKSREKKVILLRYGFVDGKEWTLEKIGNEFGLTRERVRQIEKMALKKLLHLNKSEILESFIK
ncbi:MAG: sigma-70 family RNA polymerase sigma factor [Prolixibacteraceae bacterium]|nr:sigma-70 family RNA polymerase sigma factor [Prolixibacteraceae bacterium]